MAKIRVIVASTENGSEEEVEFTEDFEAPVDDFCHPGRCVDSDTIVEVNNWPSAFPMGCTLVIK